MYLSPEELLAFMPGKSVAQLTNDDPKAEKADMAKVQEAVRAAE